MDWKTLLAYVTGSVDEQLLLWNEYLVAENGILRHQITGRLQLSDAERTTLAKIGKQLGKQALEEIANIAKPDTILGWHRKLVAQKFDGSEQRKSLGRPRVDKELGDVVDVEFVVSHRQSKCITIDEQPNNDIVEFDGLRKADRLAHQPLDPGPQR